MKVHLKNVRAAFVNLFEPKAGMDGGDPKFSMASLLPKDHPQLDEIEKAQRAVAKEKWGAKADAIYKQLAASDKLALHDGDLKENYEGFPEHFYLNASNKTRPTVVDRDRTPLVQADGKPYSGCYVNVIVEFWAQDNNYGKRINCSLKGVQFVRDGDAFSGSTMASADDFDDVSEGADADDLV